MRRIKVTCSCLLVSLFLCSCTNAEKFIGKTGYDHLNTDSQIIYEQLYSDFSKQVYESTINAKSGMDFYDAYEALEQDFESELDFPEEVLVLKEKNGWGDSINYTLRYLYSEKKE